MDADTVNRLDAFIVYLTQVIFIRTIALSGWHATFRFVRCFSCDDCRLRKSVASMLSGTSLTSSSANTDPLGFNGARNISFET